MLFAFGDDERACSVATDIADTGQVRLTSAREDVAAGAVGMAVVGVGGVGLEPLESGGCGWLNEDMEQEGAAEGEEGEVEGLEVVV